MMQTIVITAPGFVRGEADAIFRLLDSGAASRVHLRKPGIDTDSMRGLIESIPSALHSRLSLHDCLELAGHYGCGIHQNSRNQSTILSDTIHPVSYSCHTVQELGTHPDADYLFLSPVFDSISKQDYRSRFRIDSLHGAVGRRTVALGGITPAHFETLRDAGFGGAAMLGYIWQDSSTNRISNIIKEICSNL